MWRRMNAQDRIKWGLIAMGLLCVLVVWGMILAGYR
jgi:hypothetical protein